MDTAVYRFILTNYTLVKIFFEVQKFFAFLLGEFYDGHARPTADDIGDFVTADIGGGGLLFAFPIGS